MLSQLPSTAILEHFANPIAIWETTDQNIVFTNSAADRLFQNVKVSNVDKLTIWDFISDVDFSTVETNSPDLLESLHMKPTADQFPIATEGFFKLRRTDLTEFVSYIYIHDIADDSNRVTHRIAEIHVGYDELAENAQWVDYFQIREKYAIANFAGDIASQLNNGLAALGGDIDSSALKVLLDIAGNLTVMADTGLRGKPFTGIDQSDTGGVLRPPLNPIQTRNRILLVDDDVFLLEILRDLLIDNLMTVFTASSTADAMAIAESNELDVALIDLRLGSENGRDVAVKLKTLNENLHIVYMTGYASTIPRIRRHENYDVLKKPFTISDALRAINKTGSSVT